MGFSCFHVMGHENSLVRPQRKASSLIIGAGINYMMFRDLSSSPLYYSGTMSKFQLGFYTQSPKMQQIISVSYSSGSLSNNNDVYRIKADVTTFSLSYQYLKQVRAFSSNRLNTKIGGMFNILGNYRNNDGLNNFAIAYELMPSLMLSAKTELDVSRTESKRIFFNTLLMRPRKKMLSYQLNVGLVNGNFRGDIPYLLNSSVSNNLDFIEALRFKGFSKVRLGSTFNYTVYLNPSNAICISYDWNVLQTSNDELRFEQASHLIGLRLLFGINN